MVSPVAPKNYREIPFTIQGNKIQIAGMAKLDWRNHNLNESMAFLKSQKIALIISLEWDQKYENAANINAINYLNYHTADFQPPTFEQCNEIYEIAKKAAKNKNNHKMAIHCTAGRGRTGTLLAALKIREMLDSKPDIEVQQRHTEMIQLGGYGGNKFIPCTPLVKEAINQVRGVVNSSDSVEVEAQIKMLCAYQQSLSLSKKNTNKNNLIGEDHSAIKKSNEVISKLRTTKSRGLLHSLSILFSTWKLKLKIRKLANSDSGSDQATKNLNSLLNEVNKVNPNILDTDEDKIMLNSIHTEFTVKVNGSTMSACDKMKAAIACRAIPTYIKISQKLKEAKYCFTQEQTNKEFSQKNTPKAPLNKPISEERNSISKKDNNTSRDSSPSPFRK